MITAGEGYFLPHKHNVMDTMGENTTTLWLAEVYFLISLPKSSLSEGRKCLLILTIISVYRLCISQSFMLISIHIIIKKCIFKNLLEVSRDKKSPSPNILDILFQGRKS